MDTSKIGQLAQHNNKDYWQVYFDTNMLIKDSFTTAGFSVPEQHYMVRTAAAGATAASRS